MIFYSTAVFSGIYSISIKNSFSPSSLHCPEESLELLAFLSVPAKGMSPEMLPMRRKTIAVAKESEIAVDLTLHNVPASLLTEFAEKIVRPYYRGNMNAAIQDLLHKALAEQDFLLSHKTQVKTVEA